jgi:hypothetical protein
MNVSHFNERNKYYSTSSSGASFCTTNAGIPLSLANYLILSNYLSPNPLILNAVSYLASYIMGNITFLR